MSFAFCKLKGIISLIFRLRVSNEEVVNSARPESNSTDGELSHCSPFDHCSSAARVLWSQPIPIAWYFGPQWARVYGTEWAARVCNRWIENDRNLKHFAGEVRHNGSVVGRR